MEIYLYLVVSLVWLWVTFVRRKRIEGIPGPNGIPYFGNVFQLPSTKPHFKITKWANKYGPMYQLNLAGTRVLVVSGAQEIREMFLNNDFDGRVYNEVMYRATKKYKGIIFTTVNDDDLKFRRKFLHQTLKQYGTGIQIIEDFTATMVNDLCKNIESNIHDPFDVRPLLFDTFLNIGNMMIKGEVLSGEECAVIKTLVPILLETGGSGGSSTIQGLFPRIGELFHGEHYERVKMFLNVFIPMVEGWVQDAKKNTGGPSLASRYNTIDQDSRRAYNFDEDNEVTLFWEMILANSASSSYHLSSIILCLTHHPDVQARLQQEVNDVIGYHCVPHLSDKKRLPYHAAVLYETMRLLANFPLGVPRRSVRDTFLGSYKIPDNTYVWPNLWGLHHDENLWDRPYQFKPERYLDDKGQLVPADHPNRRNLLAFGAGTRVCVGKIFAETRMFLVLATLMQKFSFLPIDSPNHLSCDPRVYTTTGLIMPNEEFKVKVQLL